MLMRIKGHGMDTLCRQVYEEGRRQKWPGLGQEVAEICDKIGIPDVNTVTVDKNNIRNAIFEGHYEEMMNVVKDQRKLEDTKDDDLREVQDYFCEKSVDNVRMGFMIRTQMVPKIPGNLKKKYRVREGLECSECQVGEIMTQSHCLTCTAWEDLREGLDMDNIKDLVIFFRKLLVERSKV